MASFLSPSLSPLHTNRLCAGAGRQPCVRLVQPLDLSVLSTDLGMESVHRNHPSALFADAVRKKGSQQSMRTVNFSSPGPKVSPEFQKYLKARKAMKTQGNWHQSSDHGCTRGSVVLRSMYYFTRQAHAHDRSSHEMRELSQMQRAATSLTDGAIAQIFVFYAKVQPPSQQLARAPRSYDEVQQCNQTMSFLEFLCFARDFDLVPRYLSKHDLQGLWKLHSTSCLQATGKAAVSDVARSGVDLGQFVQLLVKIALIAFAGDRQDEGCTTTTPSSRGGGIPHQPPRPPPGGGHRASHHHGGSRSRRTRPRGSSGRLASDPTAHGVRRGTEVHSAAATPPLAHTSHLRGRSDTNALPVHVKNHHDAVHLQLRNQGKSGVDQCAAHLLRLVALLRLDQPNHATHVIQTRGKQTATRLNNYTSGEQFREENRQQLLLEAAGRCVQARRNRAENRKQARTTGVGGWCTEPTKTTATTSATQRRGPGRSGDFTRALDAFEAKQLEPEEDSSDDEEDLMPPKLRPAGLEPPQQERAVLQHASFETVQFHKPAFQMGEDWNRKFHFLSDSPLAGPPIGKQEARNIDLISPNCSAAQKAALLLYDPAFVNFLKPFIFTSRKKPLALKVPSFDLGALHTQKTYQMQIQIRNMKPEMMNLRAEAKGAFADLASFVFNGTTCIAPGLTLSVIVEIEPWRMPGSSRDMFGIIEFVLEPIHGTCKAERHQLPVYFALSER